MLGAGSPGDLARPLRRMAGRGIRHLAARVLRGVPGDDHPRGESPVGSSSDSSAVDVSVARSVAPFLTSVPPGHFYSAVPDLAEIAVQADELFVSERALPGIDLREDAQLELFKELAALARARPLAASPGGDRRYGVDNPNYGIGDALMLQSMLVRHRPKRYLEVGSGYTTALALDTSDRDLGEALAVTAIEPHPALLRQVLRPGDRVEVIEKPVQSVDLERFASLEAGDVLFLDCSHVLKTGSDVWFLYTSVLPVLRSGVLVHVHDVFWPFEYLRHWVEAGRAWNEAYLLHAFLLFNSTFEIVLWNHFLAMRHEDVVRAELPSMLDNPGGAIWLRRR